MPDAGGVGRYFCSWSGGKDCALALYRARNRWGRADALLTMMVEGGHRSRSHGVRRELLRAQAQSLAIPIRFVPAAWSDYEAGFSAALARLASAGFTHGVYGDLDIPAHKRWVEGVSSANHITALEPLWQCDRRALLSELFALGFRARVIAIKTAVLPDRILGRDLSWELIEEIEALGCDPAGEGGEYHTFTFAGPLFSTPLRLNNLGTLERDGYRFQDMEISRVHSAAPARDQPGSRIPGSRRDQRPIQ